MSFVFSTCELWKIIFSFSPISILWKYSREVKRRRKKVFFCWKFIELKSNSFIFVKKFSGLLFCFPLIDVFNTHILLKYTVIFPFYFITTQRVAFSFIFEFFTTQKFSNFLLKHHTTLSLTLLHTNLMNKPKKCNFKFDSRFEGEEEL
jgi:hypothetical protein